MCLSVNSGKLVSLFVPVSLISKLHIITTCLCFSRKGGEDPCLKAVTYNKESALTWGVG